MAGKRQKRKDRAITELFSTAQIDQFDYHAQTDDLSAVFFDQTLGPGDCSAGCHQVVDQ